MGYKTRNDISILWPLMTDREDGFEEAFILWATKPGRSELVNDHLEQVTDAPLFRAAESNRAAVRVNGWLEMDSNGPVQAWGSNIRHQVAIMVSRSDGTSQMLYEKTVDFGHHETPSLSPVAEGFESRVIVATVPKADHTLRIAQTTDSLHMDNAEANSLRVRLVVRNVAVLWPPEDIVVD